LDDKRLSLPEASERRPDGLEVRLRMQSGVGRIGVQVLDRQTADVEDALKRMSHTLSKPRSGVCVSGEDLE
jgi:hypothetical protein